MIGIGGAGDAPRSHAISGRKRAATIGQFITGQYVSGRFSAPEVQESAQRAVASGCSNDKVVRALAKAGAGGKQRGNMHRDVMTTLSKHSSMPPIYETERAFWDNGRQCQIQDKTYVLLPHEVFNSKIEQHSLDLDEYNYKGRRKQTAFDQLYIII